MMLLCINCKHFRETANRCTISKEGKEPLRGFKLSGAISAMTARTSELFCGAGAQWFEPKETTK